jgi:membrane protein DedA with SNARE-associated domain
MPIFGHLITFSGTVHWAIAHGYGLMFVAMLVDSQLVTAAGAFAAALHYFNPYTVFLISVLADFAGDVIYFSIGYFFRRTFLERSKSSKFKDKFSRASIMLAKRPWMAVVAVKITPVIPVPAIIMLGALGVKIRTFAKVSIAVALPKSLFFVLAGYFFGRSYERLSVYLHAGAAVAVYAALLIIMHFGFNKAASGLAQKIENSA